MTKPKILLIHGWDYANYTSSGCRDAWSNRRRFTEVLSRSFDVVTVNLPGFCGQPDPAKPWTLDDFVDYVDEVIKKENPDCILGYSFGGAIVLRWKERRRDMKIEAFLVSPAIIRRYERADLSFIRKMLKAILPERLISWLRDLYISRIVKNPYYSTATRVMRETYRNIVALDLRDELLNLPAPVTLIYGENDTVTPPSLIRDAISRSTVGHRFEVIPLGGHDVANSHTDELVSLIVKSRR